MISKKVTTSKSNLKRLAKYLLDGQGKNDRVGEILVSNCHTEHDPEWAIREMILTQSLNQRATGDKSYHLVVSLAPGESLTRETFVAVEKRFAEALGFGEHQRVSVLHRDTDCVHFHMAINKVHPEKHTLHEPFNDYHTQEVLCQQLEKELGLIQGRKARERDLPRMEKAAQMETLAGIETLVGHVQRNLKQAVLEARSWDEIHTAFARAGVTLKARANGLIVESGEQRAKASSCFRELSKAALEKRLGAFQPSLNDPNGKEYQPKPVQAGASQLYAQYRTEKEGIKSRKGEEIGKALADHRQRVAEAKTRYQLQKGITNVTMRGLIGKAARQFHRANLSRNIKDSHATYVAQKKAIHQAGKQLAWNDWLMKEAGQGNARALEALRKQGPSPQGQQARQQAELNVKPNPSPNYDLYRTGGNILLNVIRGLVSLYQSSPGKTSGGRPAQRQPGLRNLSDVPVVCEQKTTGMLLRAHARGDLGQGAAADPAMRREGDRADRDPAETGQGSPKTHYVTRHGDVRGEPEAPVKINTREEHER
jgi:hypothetical protein